MSIKDLGFNKILRELRLMDKSEVAVGIVGTDAQTKHPDSDLTLAEVAAVNEYGSDDGHVPERPAHRNCAADNQSEIIKNTQNAISAVLGGAKAQAVMDRLGIWYTGKVKQAIADFDSPPNAPATIKAKGANNPLIDTGRTRNSVTHVVRKLTQDK